MSLRLRNQSGQIGESESQQPTGDIGRKGGIC